ncbi:MAG TPA: NnrU family protein [Methylibium sp.]|uniref:NnrU family protein n=1 Tax=Methylibium sp. TaxID=2067992 RepID=UPI002DBCA4B6|nr:NnrU family protein [Methylibium sp.]HEU4458285.1 NnrU family protein [Methylibium sp.]
MLLLLLGLVIFLGAHSTRIVADGWRDGVVARIGAKRWKGLYALVSLVGFVLIVVGYGLARQQPVVLWQPPVWTRHAASLLVLVAFVLLAAPYVKGNAFATRLRHPMLIGTKLWAFAHLLANGTLADLLLFASFLAWAVLCFRSARRRDRAAGLHGTPGDTAATVKTVVAGVVGWAVFAFWLHGALIGVRPFG